MESTNLPIACCLSSAELRERESTLIAELKSGVTRVEELPDGYRFHFLGDARWLATIANLIAAEGECCPFLEFTLHASSNQGQFTFAITGPSGTKDFLRPLFL